MPGRIQLVAIIGSVALLLGVLELVRRRRLMERYALLWLLCAVVLIGLAAWRNALVRLSHALGIAYPPNALFFVGVGFVLLLLLHFSSAVSRLSDQAKVLAQRAALLEERLRRLEEDDTSGGGQSLTNPAKDEAAPEHQPSRRREPSGIGRE